jgi:hypothetical protein
MDPELVDKLRMFLIASALVVAVLSIVFKDSVALAINLVALIILLLPRK